MCSGPVNLLRRDIGGGTKSGHEVRFCLRQQILEITPAFKNGHTGVCSGEKLSDPVCQIGGKGMMSIREQVNFSLTDVDQGSIHTV
jgi:hypothetical protein